MKTKTYKLIAALLAGSAASLSAQQAIVGWDFSQFSQDGFSSTDGTTLNGQVNANYSTNENVETAYGAAFGNGLGTLYYDGSNGSTALGLNPSDVEPDGQRDVGIFGFTSLGDAGEIGSLGDQGQQFTNAKALGFNSGANGDSFTFGVDISGFGAFQSATDWNFAFVGFNSSDSDNSSSIQWEWSADGNTFNAGTTSNLTQNLARFDLDVSSLSGGALDGESQFFLRGTLDGVTDGRTFIDNVGVSGSAVPEPSAFAAIAGALALGFAATRRRMK